MPLSFSFVCLLASGYVASFAQQKQPRNATESRQSWQNSQQNKTSSIIDILFLKYCLDLELLHLSSWRFFSEYLKKKFSKHWTASSRKMCSDSACSGNDTLNFHLEILQSTNVKLVKSLTAMIFFRWQYSRNHLMEY